MKCPGCGGKTRVKNSRHPKNGQVKRTRICTGCGKELRTLEQPVQEKNLTVTQLNLFER